MLDIRHAPFALRVVQRKDGKAAIVYRRTADEQGRDRLQRVAAISALAYSAAAPLLFAATAADANRRPADLQAGAFHPLPADWGARVACFALVAAGLRDAERLRRAAAHLRAADADEAAWWLGLMQRDNGEQRATRALRILTEAVA